MQVPNKTLGKWKNSGSCKAVGDDPTCGPGIQHQTRDCVNGTQEKCTKEDTERQKDCFYAGTSLPECKSKM